MITNGQLTIQRQDVVNAIMALMEAHIKAQRGIVTNENYTAGFLDGLESVLKILGMEVKPDAITKY